MGTSQLGILTAGTYVMLDKILQSKAGAIPKINETIHNPDAHA